MGMLPEAAEPSFASKLSTLLDCSITAPADTQTITYNSVTGKWENTDVPGAVVRNWYPNKEIVEVGETLTIPVDFQLIIHTNITINGTLDNQGTLYILDPDKFLPDGSVNNQTLRWNGTTWVVTSVLKVDSATAIMSGLRLDDGSAAEGLVMTSTDDQGNATFKALSNAYSSLDIQWRIANQDYTLLATDATYQIFERVAADSTLRTVTMPTPSASLAGKKFVIRTHRPASGGTPNITSKFKLSGSFQYGQNNVSEIYLWFGQIVSFVCVDIGSGTYKWVAVDNLDEWGTVIGANNTWANVSMTDAFFVVIGTGNTVTYGQSVIVGSGNSVYSGAAIGKDNNCVASSNVAGFAFGWTNSIEALYGVAVGTDNKANTYALATGDKSYARKFSHAYSNGSFAAAGDSQVSRRILRAITTNGTQTEMLLPDNGRIDLPNDSTWYFDISIVARRSDANDESAAYRIKGCIDRNTTAASVALVGSLQRDTDIEDTAAWDVAVDADTTNGSLRIQVTGETGKTIRWVALVNTVEVTG